MRGKKRENEERGAFSLFFHSLSVSLFLSLFPHTHTLPTSTSPSLSLASFPFTFERCEGKRCLDLTHSLTLSLTLTLSLLPLPQFPLSLSLSPSAGHASHSAKTPTLVRMMRGGDEPQWLIPPTPLVPRSRLECVIVADQRSSFSRSGALGGMHVPGLKHGGRYIPAPWMPSSSANSSSSSGGGSGGSGGSGGPQQRALTDPNASDLAEALAEGDGEDEYHMAARALIQAQQHGHAAPHHQHLPQHMDDDHEAVEVEMTLDQLADHLRTSNLPLRFSHAYEGSSQLQRKDLLRGNTLTHILKHTGGRPRNVPPAELDMPRDLPHGDLEQLEVALHLDSDGNLSSVHVDSFTDEDSMEVRAEAEAGAETEVGLYALFKRADAARALSGSSSFLCP